MSETPNPLIKPDAPALSEPSIVDTILDLDEYLSGDVRRAEKTARFSIKPWLEAEIDELEYELEQLTDERGNPLDSEASLGEVNRAVHVAQESQEKRAEYAASMRSVRVQQLPGDKWTAFEAKWREALDKGAPYPEAMWDELITSCAIAPKISLPQVQSLRKKAGHPQVHEIGLKSWQVCTSSGVSVPKSPLSSHVLKREQRAKS